MNASEERADAAMSAREGRKFAFTVGAAFLVLAGIGLWRGHVGRSSVIGGIGVAFLALGVVVPTRLGPIQRAWMGLAHAISRVTTPIIMSAIYFLVLTPVGLVRRWLGGDSLRQAPEGQSAWVSRDETRSDLTRQF